MSVAEVKKLVTFTRLSARHDMEGYLARLMALELARKSIDGAGVVFAAYAVITKSQPSLTQTPFTDKVRARAGSLLHQMANPIKETATRSFKGCCTDYPENPMSDKTRAQWAAYRKKHSTGYVGLRFIPPQPSRSGWGAPFSVRIQAL